METNKILGAIILALLLAAVFSKVADMAIHPEFPDELAYKIEVPEGGISSEIKEEVDILKESVKAIATKTSETIDAVNKLTEVMQNGHLPEAAPSQSNLDPAKLEQMGNFFEQLSHVWNNFKGNNNSAAPAPLIDQEFINQKMKSAVLEDLATGEELRRFISRSLKQKATKAVVNTALGDLNANPTNVSHQYGPN